MTNTDQFQYSCENWSFFVFHCWLPTEVLFYLIRQSFLSAMLQYNDYYLSWISLYHFGFLDIEVEPSFYVWERPRYIMFPGFQSHYTSGISFLSWIEFSFSSMQKNRQNPKSSQRNNNNRDTSIKINFCKSKRPCFWVGNLAFDASWRVKTRSRKLNFFKFSGASNLQSVLY